MARKQSSSSEFESYVAHASVKAGASAAALQSAYKIQVVFRGGLNATQKKAFKKAADRWSRVIVGDLPSVVIGGEVIDDLMIVAEGQTIDGPGQILGQAGPTHLRPASAGAAAFLPARGIMRFDSADLAQMQADGTLLDVITHEMGHVIGIGTIWTNKGLLKGASSQNPTFTGKAAKAAYGELKGTGATVVPVENSGGAGTRNSHWRESIFRNELMSGFIAGQGNPLSKVTVASLKDLGYTVDLTAAEPYALPNLLALAEAGMLLEHAEPRIERHTLPVVPRTLPDEAMNLPT